MDTVKRFFNPQTVGSLDHIRAELLQKRNGRQLWVAAGGPDEFIDAVFIPALLPSGSCGGDEGGGGTNQHTGILASEDLFLRPDESPYNTSEATMCRLLSHCSTVMIWCNPNAGYYETTVGS